MFGLQLNQEGFGIPPMDSSMHTISPSCSEGESSDDLDPGSSSTVKARHLLKILRRFHKDHVQKVSGITDGFLGYHLKNHRPKSIGSDKHFNEMGFVYDSVLSESLCGSLILEMVRVDFKKKAPKSGLKRCLSSDDLDMIVEKNAELDRNTLVMLGFDEDRQCWPRNFRSVYDECYSSENIECRLVRCTTMLQDDRVVRKMADGDETVSYPRFNLAEPCPPRIVDEFYAMEYAEGLFKRCRLGDVWNKLDFVHKKWLGELIDEEYILVSKYILKDVCYKHKPKYVEDTGVCGNQKGLGLYCPESHLMNSEGRLDNSLSFGSLNNLLVEGRPVFNEDLDRQTQNLKNCKEMHVSPNCGDSTLIFSNAPAKERNVEDGPTSCEYNCDECTKDKGDMLVSSKNNVNEGTERQMDKVWANFRVRRPRLTKRYSDSLCRRSDRRRKEWRVARANRKCSSWLQGDGSDSDESAASRGRRHEVSGRKSRLSMSKDSQDFSEKDSPRIESTESSSISLISSVDGKEVSPGKTIKEAVTEGSTNSGSSTTMAYIANTLAQSRAGVSALRHMHEIHMKRMRHCKVTNHAGLLQLLIKEANEALTSGDPASRPLSMDDDDCFLQLGHFSIFFREKQVQKLLEADESRPLSMTEQITKAIDDCKTTCVRICNNGLASPDESADSSQCDVTPADPVTSANSEEEDETGSSTSSWSTAHEEEVFSDAESSVDEESTSVTQPVKEEESISTNQLQERKQHLATVLASWRRHCSKHVKRLPVYPCDACETFYNEVVRIMPARLLPTLNSVWMNLFLMDRESEISGVVRRPKGFGDKTRKRFRSESDGEDYMNRVLQVGGAGRRLGGCNDEDGEHSMSETDVTDYVAATPKTARKSISLRKMAIVKRQKNPPRIGRAATAAVYRVNSRVNNCHTSVSQSSLPFKCHATEGLKTSPAITSRSAVKDAST